MAKTTLEDFSAAEPLLIADPDGYSDRPADAVYVSAWNEHIGLPPKEFQRVLAHGLPGRLFLGVLVSQSGWGQIKFRLDDSAGTAMSGVRAFDTRTGTLSHQRMQVRSDAQGLGLGTRFLRNSLELCRAMGLKRISVQADEAGSYAWARLGFLPADADWQQRIRPELERRGKALRLTGAARAGLAVALAEATAEGIFTVADSPAGRKLLTGLFWEGSFDPANPRQTARLDAALARLEKKPAPRPGKTPRPPR
jgi:GNAT superfamily N-acetyltransferase